MFKYKQLLYFLSLSRLFEDVRSWLNWSKVAYLGVTLELKLRIEKNENK